MTTVTMPAASDFDSSSSSESEVAGACWVIVGNARIEHNMESTTVSWVT